MLIRISLILVIIAGLAVGILNFVIVRDKITTLQTNLANETSAKEQAQRELASTKKELDKTRTDLTQTKQKLETTEAERAKAVADAEAQTKRANQLTDDLAKTKKERDDALADLEAYRFSGLTAAQVLSLGKTLKATQDHLAAVQGENKVFIKRIANLEYELDKYRGKIQVVTLPASLKGKILVSDPKWDFVVLDVGEDQGLRPDGELLVNRGGKLVAKVIVRSMQKNRSIANVMPNWKLSEIMEGDEVIPAHPSSS